MEAQTVAEREYGDTLIGITGVLTQERMRRGITRERLAKMTGSTTERIARLEGLARTPSMETVIKVAHALGYDLILQKRVGDDELG